MKVVLNAGPIISLSMINHFIILQKVFDEILVPKAVSEEVLKKGKGKAGSKELGQAIKESQIRVRKVKDHLAVKALQKTLGRGECEAIILALEEKADLALIDEIKARKEAVRMEVDVLGTLGILKRAKEQNLIKEDLKALLQKLKMADFRIGKSLEREFQAH